MVKMLKIVVFYTITFPLAGYGIGGIVGLARLSRFLKLVGMENFPKQSGRIVLVSNHPSMKETFILPGLFFRHYALRPKYGPWVMAGANLWRSLWFPLMCVAWGRVISVNRKPKQKKRHSDKIKSAFEPAAKVLEEGGNIFFFPEGGRTFRGVGEGETYLYSAKGRKIRPLKRGVAFLASQPGVTLVPVWVEWSTRTITVGEAQNFTDVPRKEIIARTQKALLELADKVA